MTYHQICNKNNITSVTNETWTANLTFATVFFIVLMRFVSFMLSNYKSSHCAVRFVFPSKCFIWGLMISLCYLRILDSNAISIWDDIHVFNSSTTGVTCGAGTANGSRAHVLTSGFKWRSCCSMFSFQFCLLLYVLFLLLSITASAV